MPPTNNAIEDRILLDGLLHELTRFEHLAIYLKFAVGYTDRQIGELLYGSDPTIPPDRHRDRARDLIRGILRDLGKRAA